MDRQLQIYAGRDHLDTLQTIISKYAPSSENNTKAYVDDVSSRTGYKADQRLDMYDPRVRASLESAMIQHEGREYRDLTADKVLAITTGKGGSDGDAVEQRTVSTGKVTDRYGAPSADKTNTDKTSAALSKITGYYPGEPNTDTGSDGTNSTPSPTTRAAVSKIAGSRPDARTVDTDDNGSRNGPPILTRPAGMGALPAQQINVAVSSPPGSSVSVTTAGFPQ